MSQPDVEVRRARAHEAAAQQDWATVHDFVAGIEPARLTASDVELAADAAWWLTRLDDALALRQRAYAAFVAANDDRRAAFCAWYLWFDYRFKGDTAVASGWLTRAARHVADDPECREAGLVTLAHAETTRCDGNFDDAHALAAGALELGRRLRCADVVAIATMNHGDLAIAKGNTREGLAYLDDAMCSVIDGELSPLITGIIFCGVLAACFEVADLRRAGEWTNAAVAWCEAIPAGSPYHGICRVHRVEVTTLQGAWGEAETQAVRASEELSALVPEAAGEALYAIGEIRRRRGDLDGAEAAYVRAHEVGRTPQPGLALLRLRQDRADDAAVLLRLSADAIPAAPLPRAVLLDAQVEIALAVGDIKRARAACEGFDAVTECVDADNVIYGIASLARARVALAAGDGDAAAHLARRAWIRFRELRVPHEAALARAVLGRAIAASGDVDGARLELEAAHRSLQELGAMLDAERVADTLQAGEDLRPRGLTAREIEVLQLVAAGKSNREIAREMFLSEHTVSRHLQNIFAKIDVSSRAAATAFAYRYSLV